MANKFSLDFIGIGAEKAGTTWMANCLREHPEVCIPDAKELFFFNDFDPHFLAVKNYRYKRGLKWYERQFNGCRDKISGEITPTYLYSKVTAKRIKKDFPNVKIIVILRDPVERALSQYIHDKRLGVIKDYSFNEAIRMYTNYTEKGLYYKYLKYYFEIFPKKNILVLFVSDLKKDPKSSLKKIYKFLELKNTKFIPKSINKRSNVARSAKFPIINYFMMQTDYFLRKKNLNILLNILDSLGVREFAKKIRDFNRATLQRYPRADRDSREYLMRVFEKDINNLEKLIGENLKEWKNAGY